MENVIEFLTELFTSGLGYESINTARSALSSLGLTFDGHRVGAHPMVIRYLKGVFKLKPPKPRYTQIWDVNKVLIYLRKLSPVKYISLKDLTMKLIMLMALTQAARVQTLHLLSYKVRKTKFEFCVDLVESIKQNRPSFNVKHVVFRAFPPDRRLCVFTVLKEYLNRTRSLRKNCNSERLLVSYVKPYASVTRDTVSRWIKQVLFRSGINTDIFKAHSVRAAATSKANMNSVPIGDILRKAGWSSEKTFAKFYNKEIVQDDRFQHGVLQ